MSHGDMLEAAMAMFLARERVIKTEKPPSRQDIAQATRARRAWRRAFERSRDNAFCRRCLEAGLTPQEREVLVALLMVQIGMIPSSSRSVGETLNSLCLSGAEQVAALHSLSDYGPLVRRGFVTCLNPEDDPGAQIVCVHPEIVDAVLHDGCPDAPGWPVRTEAEFRDRLEGMTLALARKVNAVRTCRDHPFGCDEAQRASRQVALELVRAQAVLARHPEWKIAQVLSPLPAEGRTVLFALLGKELGFIGPGNALLTGEGLGLVVVEHPRRALTAASRFARLATTTLKEYIQPVGASDSAPGSALMNAAETEFEITEIKLREMKIERQADDARRTLPQRNDHESGPSAARVEARAPNTELAQLVLSARTREAIEMAMAHARHVRRLSEDWGLGKVIPYGRGVTLLFSGPPGTGKTAAAEALAHALKRPIVQADYAQVQSCYPGVTERRISGIFHAARRRDAVLFWDEADAMLGTREVAHRHWEVRETNVLLQELERFEGVCVLATNRKFALDAALERRITLKVEFERPDRAMRRDLWARLIPQRLPLAPDVNLDRLSEADLTGGEIKNVVLNAARLSVRRNEQGPVTMVDFQRALDMEREGRWNEVAAGRIGFTR